MFGGKYLFKRPALGESRSESAMRDAEFSCPRTQTASFSVVLQESCFAGILSLLQGCRPFAIRSPSVCSAFLAVTARIISIVIFAFNAVILGRLLSQVSHEVRKRMSPVFAYTDTPLCSTAIPVVSVIFRVVTSGLHSLPGTVFWRFVPATGACSVAPARLNRFLSKSPTIHGGRVATLTSAQPSRIAALGVASELQDSEFAVLVANFIRAMFTAPAGLDITGANRFCAKNLLRSALAEAMPIRASLASKVGSSILNCCQLTKWLPGNVFDAGRQLDRITRRHDSTPDKLDYCESSQATQSSGCSYFSTT